MSRQTISKSEAERRLADRIRQKKPDAGPVTLAEARPGEWCCVAGHGVDATVDAEGMLKELLKSYDIRDMPESVPVEKMDATNDD